MVTQAVSYLSGEDPGTIKANEEYQRAFQEMLTSLDARKNRMFDPELLALAQGFLQPTKTGSFGESLGYAAGSMREAQQQTAAENQKFAEARLNLAGRGLELERQKARERAFEREIGGAPAATPAAPGRPATAEAGPGQAATPQGAAPGAPAAAGSAVGVAPQGIKVSQGDPNFPTRERFLRTQLADGKTLSDATLAWNKLLKDNEEVRDVGTYNRALGMLFPNPNVTEVERKIGQSTYIMPAGIAFQMDAARIANDTDKYQALVQRFLAGEGGEPPKSKQQSDIEQEAAKTYASEMAKKSAEKESQLENRNQAAQRTFASATRIMDMASKSPQALGIFQNANLMSSLGTLLKETVRVGGTSVGLGDIEGAVRQSLPNVKKEDVDRVALIASELAEIELAYTQLYMAKQGQVTEGERAIVRQLGGNVSNSAPVLIKKAQLMAARSQFDMNVADKFYTLKEANPKLTYLQFERSPEYRQMTKQYNEELAQRFGGQSAVPRPAGGGQSPPAATGSQTGTAPFSGARQRVDTILGR